MTSRNNLNTWIAPRLDDLDNFRLSEDELNNNIRQYVSFGSGNLTVTYSNAGPFNDQRRPFSERNFSCRCQIGVDERGNRFLKCDCTPYPVLKANSEGPTINLPYATLLLVNYRIEGEPYSVFLPGFRDTRELTVATIRATYSLQWFRSGAQEHNRQFITWAYSYTGRQYALDRGFTFLNVLDTQELNDIIATAWEERRLVGLEIGYNQVVENEVFVFDSASFTATADTR